MTPELPLPGDRFMSRYVIASCWLRDGFTQAESVLFEGEPEFLALVLLLGDAPPYYRVAQIQSNGGGWAIADSEDHWNINFAVEDFAQSGGDV